MEKREKRLRRHVEKKIVFFIMRTTLVFVELQINWPRKGGRGRVGRRILLMPNRLRFMTRSVGFSRLNVPS